MAFTSGSATDMGDLFTKIYDYLLTQSWVDLGSSLPLETAVLVGDAHRYWRVINIETQGGTQFHTDDLEFRATVSGADLTGSGTALASSDDGPTFVAANAYDGTAALWRSTAQDALFPHWIGYDLGFGNDSAVREISWSHATGQALNEMPHDFRVQFSDDGVSWYTEWEVLGEAAWSDAETRVYANPTSVSTPYQFTSSDTLHFNLQGPGVDADQRVYFFARQDHTGSDVHSMQLNVHTDYNADWETAPHLQIGSHVSDVYMNGWNSNIDYWLYVNDRRVICIAQMNTVYTGFYAGFMLPWALPTEYDFPLYVCGDYTSKVINTYTGSGRRLFYDPGKGSGYWRDWDGDWEEIDQHDDSASINDPAANNTVYIWPGLVGATTNGGDASAFGGSSAGHTTGHFFEKILPTAQGELPVFPCLIGTMDYKGTGHGVIGALDGVWMPVGKNITNEQTFVYNGRTFRTWQNINRVQGNSFVAVEEV